MAEPRRLTPHHPDYPRGLLDLTDPPATLYVRGTLPAAQRAVAIVGSRAATPYGCRMARRLSGDLVRLGYAVVSGLARGIDAAAHGGALEAAGSTVAVLPSALDAVTPAHHRALAETIAARGALVSEHPSGAPTFRATFVRRNRLIAALASATVVVEAAERSGALSTAAAARRIGRALLAVPGDVERPTSRGCHALLRAGARVCEGPADVLEALGEAERRGPPAGKEATLSPTPERRVLDALAPTPASVEQIARRAGLAIAETLAALTQLEWSGAAITLPGQRWARRQGARR